MSGTAAQSAWIERVLGIRLAAAEAASPATQGVHPSDDEAERRQRDKQVRDDLLLRLKGEKLPDDKAARLGANLDILGANAIEIDGKRITIDGQIVLGAEMLATMEPGRVTKLGEVCKMLAKGTTPTREAFDGLDTSGKERFRFKFHLDMVKPFARNLGMSEAQMPPDLRGDAPEPAAAARFFDLVNDGHRTSNGAFKDEKVIGGVKEACDFAVAMTPETARKHVELMQFHMNFTANQKIAANWTKQKRLLAVGRDLAGGSPEIPALLRTTLAEIVQAGGQDELLAALSAGTLREIPAAFAGRVAIKRAELEAAAASTKDAEIEKARLDAKTRLEGSKKKPSPGEIDAQALEHAQRQFKARLDKAATVAVQAEFDLAVAVLKARLAAPGTPAIDAAVVGAAYTALEGALPEPAPVSLAIDDLWNEAALVKAIVDNAASLTFSSKAAAIYHAEKHFVELLATGYPEVGTFLAGRAPDPVDNRRDVSKAKTAFAETFTAVERLALYVESARLTVRLAATPQVRVGQGGGRMVTFPRGTMKSLVPVGDGKQAVIATFMSG